MNRKRKEEFLSWPKFSVYLQKWVNFKAHTIMHWREMIPVEKKNYSVVSARRCIEQQHKEPLSCQEPLRKSTTSPQLQRPEANPDCSISPVVPHTKLQHCASQGNNPVTVRAAFRSKSCQYVISELIAVRQRANGNRLINVVLLWKIYKTTGLIVHAIGCTVAAPCNAQLFYASRNCGLGSIGRCFVMQFVRWCFTSCQLLRLL